MKKVLLTLLAAVVVLASCSSKKESKEPVMEQEKTMVAEEPSVFFKSPANGATVPSPVFVEMGVKGMKIEPAGQVNEGFGQPSKLARRSGDTSE